MKKIFFLTSYLFCVFFLNPFRVASGQISQEWIHRYNGTGNGNDYPSSIIIDDLDNVFVTGRSFGVETDNDFTTIKYNSSGIPQWIQKYNGPANGYDFALSSALDDSKNVYVAGSSTGIGTGTDFTTIKYNSSGEQQWIQRYNGPSDSNDAASSIALDTFGNVYVLGDSKGTRTGFDIILVKYNSFGAEQWVARYNSGSDTNDFSLEVIIDKNQDVCVAGLNFNSNGTYTKYITLKYNKSGILQWAQIYNGPVDEFNTPHDFALDSANNIYITGCSPGIGSGFYDFCTIKYSSDGDLIWLKRYNYFPTGYDVANSIAIGTSGNVYVTGYSGYTSSPNNFDFATVKYDSSGNELWVRRYNGMGNAEDRAQFIGLDSLENVYVVGRSFGSGTGVDYVTVKYNSSGQQQWIMRYDGSINGEDIPTGIAVFNSGLIYLTGYSQGSGTGYDYATIKYSQQIGVTPISSKLPVMFNLYQNYPNPFNPSTNIIFTISKSSITKLIVFDIVGREVTTLVNEHLSRGSYQVGWIADNYPSGMYLYKLITEDFSETKKMNLIK